jgi:excisionase family DNA binding protein
VIPDDLIGTREAARVAAVSVPTIKRAARTGALPHAVKMPGGTGAYLFRRSDVETYRASREGTEEVAS